MNMKQSERFELIARVKHAQSELEKVYERMMEYHNSIDRLPEMDLNELSRLRQKSSEILGMFNWAQNCLAKACEEIGTGFLP